MTVRDGTDRGRPPAGREPRAAPAAVLVGLVVGVGFFIVGAICIRDLLIAFDVTEADPWLASVSTWIARLSWSPWMQVAAPVAVVAGLLLLVIGLKPRRRTHIALRADLPTWITPTGLARACSARAARVEGVTQARTSAGRRRITVRVTVVDSPHTAATPDDSLIDAVEDAVRPAVAALRRTPAVRVRVAHTAPKPPSGSGRVR